MDWPAEKEGQPVDVQEAYDEFEERWSTDTRTPSGVLRSHVKPLNTPHEVGIDCHVSVAMGGWGMNKVFAYAMPTDIGRWSNHILNVVRILNRHAPNVEYIYFFTENEAVLQQSHLLHGADGTMVSGAQYQGLASRAAMEKIHHEFPQIKLIGPTNWGPPLGGPDGVDFVGDRFEDTLKPYLEAVWDQLYAFNYHNYYLGYTRENTGELQTLINFMRNRFSEDKPIFMNEGNIGCGDWAAWVKEDDRALWIYNGFVVLRTMMWAIDNLDKQQVLCWHD